MYIYKFRIFPSDWCYVRNFDPQGDNLRYDKEKRVGYKVPPL